MQIFWTKIMISEQEILNASILIVDDQNANVQLLEQMLRDVGYASITSATRIRIPSVRCIARTAMT